MLSIDVRNLYTSIPHGLGIEAIKYWTKEYSEIIGNHTILPVDFIIDGIKIILENNTLVTKIHSISKKRVQRWALQLHLHMLI